MFTQMFVCSQGGVGVWSGGGCLVRGGFFWSGGGLVIRRGALVRGGWPAQGGVVWSEGEEADPSSKMATATVGTHPTVMHSCFHAVFGKKIAK